MKNLAILIVLIIAIAGFLISRQTAESKPASGQDRSLHTPKPEFVRAASFAASGRIDALNPTNVATGSANPAVRELSGGFAAPGPAVDAVRDADAAPAIFSGVEMPVPSLSFDGLANLDNVNAYSLLIIPPDMNGDVGPQHYVQIVNSLVRVFDKNGQPLSAPIRLNEVFAPLGTVCSTRIDGLATVLYDPLADRWLLSQVCSAFPPFRQMIAVSKTGDPLAGFFLYEFVMPNIRINDFPKFGIWPDGYYMSTDEFQGSDYFGAGAFAFDRAKLLAGDPAAGYIYFSLPASVPIRRSGLLPSDLDGLNPAATGAPNIFASYTATEYGDQQDAIRLFNFHADFANPANSTFTESAESPLAVAAFDPTSPEGRADIAQPAPGERLDSQSDRLMFRLAYRNFGSHESLVFNQTVRLTPLDQPYRAGVRVYELRRTSGGFTVREQSTIGDTAVSRWIASVAQDHIGSTAVQYNHGGDDKKPSIFYTGRLAADPPGTFRPEGTLVNGTGVQKAFGWRWGEYSGMSVDPADDCTFWMTNSYYTQESQDFSDFGWLTRIGRFKFAECTPAPRASITGVVSNASTGQPILNALVSAASYSRNTNAQGSYGNLMVLPGAYNVTASARGYLPQTVGVSVINGQTFTQNFSLQPVPIIENTSAGITDESCRVNQAAEPGEIVTINIGLRNTGSLNAADLTATLLVSGGVTNPGAPQNYGPVPAGGASVTRPFTFTVSPSVNCGADIVMTFQLRDGASDIGSILINLRAGELRFAFRENFDGVLAPALPEGWTTAATENHQLWRTSSARTQSAPNSLFSPAPHQMGINEIVSPLFAVTSPSAEVSFRNWYELETTFLRNRLYDGSVMEIKIGDGAFTDILAAGGLWLSGGYDGTIDGCCQNPLAGRLGWSGRSGIDQVSVFITSRAKLPVAAMGQNVRLRWRIGSDIGGHREGQYIDDLAVTDGYSCGCAISRPRPAPFDFDGDRKTDLAVFNFTDSGTQPDFRLINSSTGAAQNTFWGSSGDIATNADFDGDGKTDYAVFRPSTGIWYVLKSSDSNVVTVNFGLAGDKVTPADFDADGRTDFAVYRPSNGIWYGLWSSDSQTFAYRFGIAEDAPVNADYDGDGRADIAVYRPSTGVWYIARSSDGGVTITSFGISEDKPAPGDFDGDGKTDLAVFRPSTGIWYVLQSTGGFFAVQFGLAGDLPLQTDFDADGRADIAVFRPSSKVWYHLRSSDGAFSARLFGDIGDSPVPAIYTGQ